MQLCTTGIELTDQIMIYSEPERKGRLLALWQSMYQLATTVGGAINLALNIVSAYVRSPSRTSNQLLSLPHLLSTRPRPPTTPSSFCPSSCTRTHCAPEQAAKSVVWCRQDVSHPTLTRYYDLVPLILNQISLVSQS